jgi:hypothetical protein
MDNKSPATADTTADASSDMKTEADFLAQAGQARVALEQLSTVLGMKTPSELLLLAAMDQIMKSIVCSPFFIPISES